MRRQLFVALAVFFLAPAAFAGVSGTAHDLSSGSGPNPTYRATNVNQICVFCHTPHAASPAVPLWNHSLSAEGAYTMYSSSTMDSTAWDFAGGTAVSNLCMSCHDGTVAVGVLVNDPGGVAPDNSTAADRITGVANLGTDLSNDHPVNMTYDAALVAADGELVAVGSLPGTIQLFNGTVQCASCHDPHNNANVPFLVMANTASALCLSCHVK